MSVLPVRAWHGGGTVEFGRRLRTRVVTTSVGRDTLDFVAQYGRVTDAQGRLLAHGTTTRLIFPA